MVALSRDPEAARFLAFHYCIEAIYRASISFIPSSWTIVFPGLSDNPRFSD